MTGPIGTCEAPMRDWKNVLDAVCAYIPASKMNWAERANMTVLITASGCGRTAALNVYFKNLGRLPPFLDYRFGVTHQNLDTESAAIFDMILNEPEIRKHNHVREDGFDIVYEPSGSMDPLSDTYAHVPEKDRNVLALETFYEFLFVDTGGKHARLNSHEVTGNALASIEIMFVQGLEVFSRHGYLLPEIIMVGKNDRTGAKLISLDRKGDTIKTVIDALNQKPAALWRSGDKEGANAAWKTNEKSFRLFFRQIVGRLSMEYTAFCTERGYDPKAEIDTREAAEAYIVHHLAFIEQEAGRCMQIQVIMDYAAPGEEKRELRRILDEVHEIKNAAKAAAEEDLCAAGWILQEDQFVPFSDMNKVHEERERTVRGRVYIGALQNPKDVNARSDGASYWADAGRDYIRTQECILMRNELVPRLQQLTQEIGFPDEQVIQTGGIEAGEGLATCIEEALTQALKEIRPLHVFVEMWTDQELAHAGHTANALRFAIMGNVNVVRVGLSLRRLIQRRLASMGYTHVTLDEDGEPIPANILRIRNSDGAERTALYTADFQTLCGNDTRTNMDQVPAPITRDELWKIVLACLKRIFWDQERAIKHFNGDAHFPTQTDEVYNRVLELLLAQPDIANAPVVVRSTIRLASYERAPELAPMAVPSQG